MKREIMILGYIEDDGLGEIWSGEMEKEEEEATSVNIDAQLSPKLVMSVNIGALPTYEQTRAVVSL